MVRYSDHQRMDIQGLGDVNQGRLYGEPGGQQKLPMGTAIFSASTDGSGLHHLNESKRRLAKRANEIYRSLCDELDLGECFFHGFGAWSEFVEGKLSESSFYEQAKAEARVIARESE